MLLATAGGPGPGLELVCCCGVAYPWLIGAFVIAVFAAVRRSVWLAVLSVLLVASSGILLHGAHTERASLPPTPTDDSDEISARRALDELLATLIRDWEVAAAAVGATLPFVIARRITKRRPGTAVADRV